MSYLNADLRQRIVDIGNEINKLRNEREIIRDAIFEKTEEIQKLKSELRRNGKIKVTDHAVCQYMRRILDIDLDQKIASILPDDIEDRIKDRIDDVDGTIRLPCNGMILVIENMTVITVLKDD
jgi:hypothetical protein